MASSEKGFEAITFEKAKTITLNINTTFFEKKSSNLDAFDVSCLCFDQEGYLLEFISPKNPRGFNNIPMEKEPGVALKKSKATFSTIYELCFTLDNMPLGSYFVVFAPNNKESFKNFEATVSTVAYMNSSKKADFSFSNLSGKHRQVVLFCLNSLGTASNSEMELVLLNQKSSFRTIQEEVECLLDLLLKTPSAKKRFVPKVNQLKNFKLHSGNDFEIRCCPGSLRVEFTFDSTTLFLIEKLSPLELTVIEYNKRGMITNVHLSNSPSSKKEVLFTLNQKKIICTFPNFRKQMAETKHVVFKLSMIDKTKFLIWLNDFKVRLLDGSSNEFICEMEAKYCCSNSVILCMLTQRHLETGYASDPEDDIDSIVDPMESWLFRAMNKNFGSSIEYADPLVISKVIVNHPPKNVLEQMRRTDMIQILKESEETQPKLHNEIDFELEPNAKPVYDIVIPQTLFHFTSNENPKLSKQFSYLDPSFSYRVIYQNVSDDKHLKNQSCNVNAYFTAVGHNINNVDKQQVKEEKVSGQFDIKYPVNDDFYTHCEMLLSFYGVKNQKVNVQFLQECRRVVEAKTFLVVNRKVAMKVPEGRYLFNLTPDDIIPPTSKTGDYFMHIFVPNKKMRRVTKDFLHNIVTIESECVITVEMGLLDRESEPYYSLTYDPSHITNNKDAPYHLKVTQTIDETWTNSYASDILALLKKQVTLVLKYYLSERNRDALAEIQRISGILKNDKSINRIRSLMQIAFTTAMTMVSYLENGETFVSNIKRATLSRDAAALDTNTKALRELHKAFGQNFTIVREEFELVDNANKLLDAMKKEKQFNTLIHPIFLKFLESPTREKSSLQEIAGEIKKIMTENSFPGNSSHYYFLGELFLDYLEHEDKSEVFERCYFNCAVARKIILNDHSNHNINKMVDAFAKVEDFLQEKKADKSLYSSLTLYKEEEEVGLFDKVTSWIKESLIRYQIQKKEEAEKREKELEDEELKKFEEEIRNELEGKTRDARVSYRKIVKSVSSSGNGVTAVPVIELRALESENKIIKSAYQLLQQKFNEQESLIGLTKKERSRLEASLKEMENKLLEANRQQLDLMAKLKQSNISQQEFSALSVQVEKWSKDIEAYETKLMDYEVTIEDLKILLADRDHKLEDKDRQLRTLEKKLSVLKDEAKHNNSSHNLKKSNSSNQMKMVAMQQQQPEAASQNATSIADDILLKSKLIDDQNTVAIKTDRDIASESDTKAKIVTEVEAARMRKEQEEEKEESRPLTAEQPPQNAEFEAAQQRAAALEKMKQQQEVLLKQEEELRKQQELQLLQQKAEEELKHSKLAQAQEKETLMASRRKEVIDDYIQRILKNDPLLLEIHLDNQQVDDCDVIDICEALKENHLVKVLDFSGNPNIVGSSMDVVCELLEKTKTLDQLLFHGCPIEHDKVLQLIKSLQVNRSLTQCTSGDNETEADIVQIESIMDRNYNSSI